MNRLVFLFLLFSLPMMSAASEEEVVPWRSALIKSPELPIIGVISVDASTDDGTYQKLIASAFGRAHTLTAAELKRLEGFPLSSLTLTHEAGYAPLGGHTLHLKFSRTVHGEGKKSTREAIVISIPKEAPLTISAPKPQ
ncbi:MAG TPA: hypothetical protein VF614_06275 [Chthoniobacteraceae bacterium]|jgi:hypothetical protein